MKVKDLIKKINDPKLYIEIKEQAKNGGGSRGFYTKNDIIYNTKILNYLIYSINIQYINNKRLLVLEIK